MSIAKVGINYQNLSAIALVARGWGCYENALTHKLKVNPTLPMAIFKKHLQTLDVAQLTYQTENSTTNFDILKAAKLQTSKDLHSMGMFFNLTYGGVAAMLHKTGLPLTGAPSGETELVKVSKIEVGRGVASGTINVKWKWVRGINTYLILYTDNPLLSQNLWRIRPSIGLHALEIHGLTPGTKYSVCIVPLTKASCQADEYLYSNVTTYICQ